MTADNHSFISCHVVLRWRSCLLASSVCQVRSDIFFFLFPYHFTACWDVSVYLLLFHIPRVFRWLSGSLTSSFNVEHIQIVFPFLTSGEKAVINSLLKDYLLKSLSRLLSSSNHDLPECQRVLHYLEVSLLSYNFDVCAIFLGEYLLASSAVIIPIWAQIQYVAVGLVFKGLCNFLSLKQYFSARSFCFENLLVRNFESV